MLIGDNAAANTYPYIQVCKSVGISTSIQQFRAVVHIYFISVSHQGCFMLDFVRVGEAAVSKCRTRSLDKQNWGGSVVLLSAKRH